jgi:hypothetical protein
MTAKKRKPAQPKIYEVELYRRFSNIRAETKIVTVAAKNRADAEKTARNHFYEFSTWTIVSIKLIGRFRISKSINWSAA